MEIQEICNYFKKHPWAYTTGKGKLSRILKCFPEDIEEARLLYKNKKSSNKIPKILILDIETAPMKAYVWKRWKENISLDQTISEWFCLSWSAGWLHSEYIMSSSLTPKEVLAEDDSRIITLLRDLLDEADIVVAHNGNKFDLPKINSRCLVNEIAPPSPYFSVDTLKIAQKTFGFSSNKLDALATYLHIPNKLETNFDLWKRCMEGDQEALKRMETYNIQDVAILKEVYLKLRPWIKNHPNVGNIVGKSDVCATCGSSDLEPIPGKYYYTSVNRYPLYKCKKCGAIMRGRDADQLDIRINKVSLAH